MTTTVKEKPILFSAPMIRALLDGRKTQTRRVVDLRRVLSPAQKKIGFQQCDDPALYRRSTLVAGVPRLCIPVRHPNDASIPWAECSAECLYCPYEVGMRLWVRETWGVTTCSRGKVCVRWKADGRLCHALAEENGEGDLCGYAEECKHEPWEEALAAHRWRPSIHMPRWASRITLEVTDVRVERVQDISEEDALAEGCPGENVCWKSPYIVGPHTDDGLLPSEQFAELWDSINGDRPGCSWADNPWTWAISFKRT